MRPLSRRPVYGRGVTLAGAPFRFKGVIYGNLTLWGRQGQGVNGTAREPTNARCLDAPWTAEGECGLIPSGHEVVGASDMAPRGSTGSAAYQKEPPMCA